MKQITRFNNCNYTIGGHDKTVLFRNNLPGKVITLTIEEAERMIAELDATVNQLAKEALKNG